MANIVDRFNVEGEDYFIEPVMDTTPTEGSEKAITSGGVYAYSSSVPTNYDKRFFTSEGAYADKSNVPVNTGTAADEVARKNFTAGGAFEFFGHTENVRDWYPMMFPYLMGNTWHWRQTNAFSGSVYTSCKGYYRGSVIIGTSSGAALITANAYNANAITGLPSGATVRHIICPNGIALLGTDRDGLFYANMNGTYSPAAVQCTGIPSTKVRVLALRYIPKFGNVTTNRPLYIAVTEAYDSSSPANSNSVWVSTDAINWERASGIDSTDTFMEDCICFNTYHTWILSKQRKVYENVVDGDIAFHQTATIGTAGTAMWLAKVDGYLACATVSSGSYQLYVYARTPPSMSSGSNRAWQTASASFSGTEPACPKFNYMGASRAADGTMCRLTLDNANGYQLKFTSGIAANVILNGVAFIITNNGSGSSETSTLRRRVLAANQLNSDEQLLYFGYTSSGHLRGLTYADGILYALCGDGSVLYSNYQDIIDQFNEHGPQAACTDVLKTDTNFVGVYPVAN